MKNPVEKLSQYLENQETKINKDELLFLIENQDFESKPCDSFSEFVNNPFYLGVGEETWVKVKEEGDKIWKLLREGKIAEAVLLWGIGSGKSYLSSVMVLLLIHYLLCLKNPHKYYGLTNDKPIAVVNMGVTATQAKNVIFTGMRKLIESSPFFQRYKPEILQTEIRFQNKNLALYCGNSQETMPIGLNIIFGVLDEAAWYLDNEDKSIAENIYNTLKNRIISRFGNKGFVMIISAVRYVDDFITRLFEKSKNLDFVYASRYKTWEVKDRNKMSIETFDFITEVDKEGKPLEIWKEIPNDFKRVAESNPEKFMRDFGAKPSLVLESYDRDANIIERLVSERESPIDIKSQLKDWFKCEDKEPRFIHIDLGLKKDACGFAMGKLNDYDIVEGEKRPKVFIDLVLQIKAQPNEEIIFSEVRKLIYSLQDRKFNIQKVTFDGWQSVDSIQILKERGIEAEVLSVDKDTKAYDTLKEMLHTKRFDCYSYEPLIKEYKRLEYIKGKKVDHPPGGSKDVSDAIAGVCYNVAKYSEEFTGVRFRWL